MYKVNTSYSNFPSLNNSMKKVNSKIQPPSSQKISFGSDPSVIEAVGGGALGTFLFTGGPALILLGSVWAVSCKKNIAAGISKIWKNSKTICEGLIKKMH